MSRKERLEKIVQNHRYDRVCEETRNSRKFRLKKLVTWNIPCRGVTAVRELRKEGARA